MLANPPFVLVIMDTFLMDWITRIERVFYERVHGKVTSKAEYGTMKCRVRKKNKNV